MSSTPILLSLQATASLEGDPSEAMQLLTSGELETLPDGYVLRYEETLDEDAPPTQVQLSLQKGVVSMLRHGAYETNMVFRKGQRYESQYLTPQGAMELAIFPTKVDFQVDPQGGKLRLQYQLDLNGQFAAMHDLDLRFAVKQSHG